MYNESTTVTNLQRSIADVYCPNNLYSLHDSKVHPRSMLTTLLMINYTSTGCVLHLPPEYTCPSCNGPMWVPIFNAPVLVSTWRRIVPSPKNKGFRASTTIVSKYVFQSRWGSSGCKQESWLKILPHYTEKKNAGSKSSHI